MITDPTITYAGVRAWALAQPPVRLIRPGVRWHCLVAEYLADQFRPEYPKAYVVVTWVAAFIRPHGPDGIGVIEIPLEERLAKFIRNFVAAGGHGAKIGGGYHIAEIVAGMEE